MAGVGAVGEVLGTLDHDIQRRGEGLAAARVQQRHPRRFDEPLELLQRREHSAAVPVLVMRALRTHNSYALVSRVAQFNRTAAIFRNEKIEGIRSKKEDAHRAGM